MSSVLMASRRIPTTPSRNTVSGMINRRLCRLAMRHEVHDFVDFSGVQSAGLGAVCVCLSEGVCVYAPYSGHGTQH